MKIWAEDFELKFPRIRYDVPYASYSRKSCEQWVSNQKDPSVYEIWHHNGAFDVRRYA